MRAGGGARSVAAVVLAVCAALAALLMLPPPLARWMWIARLILREMSLAITALALLAGVLARPVAGDRRRRLALWLAIPAAAMGVLPFASQLVVLERLGLPFSPAEYAFGLHPPEVRVERGVVLDSRAEPLRADVYHAPGAGPHPFVVLAHGGGWRGGGPGEGVHLTRSLAAAGYTVADVDYRLAPGHPFPAGISDLKCAVGRLRERADALGLDPDRGVLLGRSAGGQMTLVAAYSAGDPRIPPSCDVEDAPVQGVVALYAPVDLVFGHANPMRPVDVVEGNRSIELYLGGPPRGRRGTYRLASPRSWVDRALPPTLLLHGESDRIVGSLHSALLAAELQAGGCPVRFVRVPFGEHGFEMRPGSVAEQLARGAILEFLAQRQARTAIPPSSESIAYRRPPLCHPARGRHNRREHRDRTTAPATAGGVEGMSSASVVDLARAFDFAARKHRNQRRKGAVAEPYVNHPAEVARLLAETTRGEDPACVLAGLLHDTIEDTETTREELVREFGEEVAALVGEVTDDKSLPKAERKRLQIEKTPAKSRRAKMIKLADKTSNLRSIATSPPADWSAERKHEYLDWAAQVVAGCRGVDAGLEAAFDAALDGARRALRLDAPGEG